MARWSGRTIAPACGLHRDGCMSKRLGTVIAGLAVLLCGCPPDCPTGQKDDISSWVTLSSAYIVVPAHKVACIGVPFSGEIDSGTPLSTAHFLTDKRADGSIVLEGLVPAQVQADAGLSSFSPGSSIRFGIADCPAGDFTIDYMNPVGDFTLMDVPYSRHTFENLNYDSATDPMNAANRHFVTIERDTAFCFDNATDGQVRVLFEAFLPSYTCIPESQPASKIVAHQSAINQQTCAPMMQAPPTPKTCSGEDVMSGANTFTIPIIDAIGCGNTWVTFANDESEAKHCAMLAGYTPVDDVCLFNVELFEGYEVDNVASDSGDHAVNCAKFEPGGCTNCNASVLSEGACLTGAR
jgi:hypothetical protein